MHALKSIPLAALIALAALAGCDRSAPDRSPASGGASTTPGTRGAQPGAPGTTPSSTGSRGMSSTGTSSAGTSSADMSSTGTSSAGTSGTGTSSTGAGTGSSASTSGTTPPPTVAQANTGSQGAAGGATSASVSANDRKFMTEAAGDGMYEVAVGKLAAEKASNPAVRKFGQTIVSDHTKANNELKQLATSKGVTLPTELPSDKKAKLDKLSKASGADFDKQFVQTVGLQDHMADIKKFQTAAKDSQDPQVKAFAQKTLPTLQQHHSAAEKLASNKGAGSR